MKIANKISLSFLITAAILSATALITIYTVVRDNLEQEIFEHLIR